MLQYPEALRIVQTFVMSLAEPVHAISKTLDFWRSLPRASRVPQTDALSNNMLSFHGTALCQIGALHAAGLE